MDLSGRRGVTGALLAGFLLLLINSAYLRFFSDPTLWYFIHVAVHPVLGIGLAAAAVWAGVPRGARPARILLGLGLVLGLVILIVGATTPHKSLVNTHAAVSALGATLMLAYG